VNLRPVRRGGPSAFLCRPDKCHLALVAGDPFHPLPLLRAPKVYPGQATALEVKRGKSLMKRLDVIPAWASILRGDRPFLAVEITRECSETVPPNRISPHLLHD